VKWNTARAHPSHSGKRRDGKRERRLAEVEGESSHSIRGTQRAGGCSSRSGALTVTSTKTKKKSKVERNLDEDRKREGKNFLT